jgi:hypothetical protein
MLTIQQAPPFSSPSTALYSFRSTFFMSAFQYAAASTEVARFLSCCDDVVRRGTQTLSVSSVLHRLEHLEAEWRSFVASSSQCSVSACTQALQHYFEVYHVCARTVPLPQAAWDCWATGITTSFTVSDAGDASTDHLETVRKELSMTYWSLYCRLHWGCACASKPRLAFAVEEARAATITAVAALVGSKLESAMTASSTCGVEVLERALSVPLHTFAKLAHDMSHLFSDYGVVGTLERQWLNEDILDKLGDSAEVAVEALVRRSFKRDLQVPSASLPSLLQEYEESEVEERKAREIVALGKATLRLSWMQAAAALHQHLMDLSIAASAVASSSQTTIPHRVLYDDKAYELLEELLKELRKAPHHRGGLAALGLLTHGIVEWQDRPSLLTSSSSSTAKFSRGPGLSGSQTQFYLFLLQQWFSHYIASQHRWSVSDVFNAVDDSDLWTFVLDRHSFCLMWALATFDTDSAAGNAAASLKERQQLFAAVMDSKIDRLRCVLYSVVHCLQLYRASVASFTNPEKRTVRLTTARDAVHGWVSQAGATTTCRGLLGDLLDTAEEWEDSDMQTPQLQLWALSAEAELKLIMYDTMQFLGCPNNTTERVETLVQVALGLAESWKEKLTEQSPGEPPVVDTGLFAPVAALVVRVVQRVREELRRSCESTTELRGTDAEVYMKLVGWLKRLIAVVGAYVKTEQLNAVWDEYMFLVTLPAPSASAALDPVSPSTPDVVPALMGYTTFAVSRAFGTQSSTSGGLEDICWERRNTFTMHRKEEERHRAARKPEKEAALRREKDEKEGNEGSPKRARTE